MRLAFIHAAVTLLVVLAVALAGAAVFVSSGVYDVSVLKPHLQPVYTLLATAMHRSVSWHSRDVEVPPLSDPGLTRRGAELYIEHCLQCHGAPGVAQAGFARSMQPVPGPLVDVVEIWRPRELYWITRNGIKMSGMPAWRPWLSEEDLWALVAFLRRFHLLTAKEFAVLLAQPRQGAPAAAPAQPGAPAAELPDGNAGDPLRGRLALHLHACNACHIIPGVTGPNVHVGPPLAGVGSRLLIAGAVPNTTEQMVRWLLDPKSIEPLTAMPAVVASERDARDMAAYLATLRYE